MSESSAYASAVPMSLSDNLDQLQLETGDDSFEVQVPDFHFDWGVLPEKPAAHTQVERTRSDRHQTPSPQQTVSAHSSASSAHVMGLTDASTVSGSSMVPTPPQLLRRDRESLGSSGGKAALSSSGRRFQRVVSAPIGRPSDMDESRSTITHTHTQTHTATATMRPALNHTSSGTAVSRSTYATPGLVDRSSALAVSTNRRVGNLSRFGGPARRVIAPLEEPEESEPALISSPDRVLVPSPPPPQLREAGPSRAARMPSPPPVETPFRPFDTNLERGGREHASQYEREQYKSRPEEFHYAASRAAPVPEPVAAPPAPAPVQAGKRTFAVNDTLYERIGMLGRGGSSKVYSVMSHKNRQIYALKRVALDRADFETLQSYTNEIELLKRLNGHDRIIKLIEHQISYSSGTRPKLLMMVLECGEIDFALLLDEQRGQPLNMNFVGMYWGQMLEAVHAVHQENVVHTDLKPANFVLVKGRLKIIDFGIAKAVANDTVNIQRDQQIGTVNYMSPEAIQRMNNQKVLKLSYPSDVWSLGCILYQMVYGNPPFHSVGGGPLHKMNAIADPSHRIDYPAEATPRPFPGASSESMEAYAVTVPRAAIDAMNRCLEYKKDLRLTIPELLVHEFLRPKQDASALPPGSTSITQAQMAMLVNFILQENRLPKLGDMDTTAQDLFNQLEAQNALTR